MELIEFIAVQSGCEFISDLHSISRKRLYDAVEMAESGRYTLKEWSDLFVYVTGNKCLRGDCGACKAALLEYLRKIIH